ncbi:MAG: hypothetical protein GXP25_01095 [Planctomycetes bacterium]|nr:hypothetical protein [Planctomycetota bacterium]
MLKFSIGFNGSIAFTDAIQRHRDRIEEIYFAPPGLTSGRASAGRLGTHSYTLCLHQMLVQARDLGIPTNAVFDTLCVGSDYGSNRQGEKIVSIMRIHTELYKVGAATFVSPIDAQLVKRQFPQVKVCASVNMFVRNPVQAREVAPFCDVLILDRTINRDLDAIQAIKRETGKEIRLLANEACVFECRNRIQHLNHLSHQQGLGTRSFFPCIHQYERDHATILKAPIIRPEDLHHYEGVADSIQLSTRITADDRLDLMLQAYTSGQFSGNLFGIVESPGLDGYIAMKRRRDGQDPYFNNAAIPPDFWERATRCGTLCRDCTYCDEIAQGAFTLAPFQRAEAPVP